MTQLLSKCTARASRPNSTTFPELPTVTTWFRFIIGGLYGVSLGLRNETRGMIGALFGLNVIAFLPMFWFNSYLDANVDSYKTLNFVGVANGFAFMILIWVILFTWEHGDAEESLGNVFAEVAARGAAAIEGAGVEPVLTSEPDVLQTGMEDEF